MKGRFLLHCSDPANWRLRNMEEHPFDPGWEVGSYSVCHCKIRPHINVGTWIFDVVVRDQKGILRSAFEIRKVLGVGKSRALYFDEYYFADGEPIELPDRYIQYRCITLETFVSKYKLDSLWDEITQKYTIYKKGQRPKSIDSKSWNNIVQKGSQLRKEYTGSRCKKP